MSWSNGPTAPRWASCSTSITGAGYVVSIVAVVCCAKASEYSVGINGAVDWISDTLWAESEGSSVGVVGIESFGGSCGVLCSRVSN